MAAISAINVFFFENNNNRKRWNFNNKTKKKNHRFASFKVIYMIFCAKESWRSIFFKSKVFYPLKSFLPPFLPLKHSCFRKHSKTRFCWKQVYPKRGGKNFWGGKKLLIGKVWTFSFIVHKKIMGIAQKPVKIDYLEN